MVEESVLSLREIWGYSESPIKKVFYNMMQCFILSFIIQILGHATHGEVKYLNMDKMHHELEFNNKGVKLFHKREIRPY